MDVKISIEDFKESLLKQVMPTSLNTHQQALWYDAHGEWEKSHSLVDQAEDSDSAWIHAYLHRKEGDIWNADYWYGRAGRKRPLCTLAEEWENLVEEFLG